MIGEGVRVGRFCVGVRGVTSLWRLGVLVAATEQIVDVNWSNEEDAWTFGQVYALLLLLVPLNVIGEIVYHEY